MILEMDHVYIDTSEISRPKCPVFIEFISHCSLNLFSFFGIREEEIIKVPKHL